MFGIKIVKTRNYVGKENHLKVLKALADSSMQLKYSKEHILCLEADCDSLRLQLNEEIKRRLRAAEEICQLQKSLMELRGHIEEINTELENNK